MLRGCCDVNCSRQASAQIENLQEQLRSIAAQRDRAVLDLASSQEQADQYQTSLNNLQLVLEQFQRGGFDKKLSLLTLLCLPLISHILRWC